MRMEKSYLSTLRKLKELSDQQFVCILYRWMLISQIFQGLLILVVGYTYRSIKKMSRLANAKQMKMGTVIPNEV